MKAVRVFYCLNRRLLSRPLNFHLCTVLSQIPSQETARKFPVKTVWRAEILPKSVKSRVPIASGIFFCVYPFYAIHNVGKYIQLRNDNWQTTGL
jgi:hypothetical protein